jgi:hypothetical protein
MRRGGDQGDRHGDGQREQQSPADRTGAAELAGQRAALGIPEPAQCHRRQQVQVGGRESTVHRAGRRQEREDRQQAADARQPEQRGRAFTGPQHREHRGHGGQQGDDDRAVRRGLCGERQRGEQREPDHDAGRDHREPPPLRAGRPGRAGEPQVDRRQHGRADRPAERDEPRVELLDRDPGGGQRHAEGHHAQGSENEARYRPGRSSATLVSHE